ncbi:MAG: DNA-processing protein DprA [Vampirovibrionales bacterium]|nr:DNA-processing protein DprA [Vampirovibrionales bacterium]
MSSLLALDPRSLSLINTPADILAYSSNDPSASGASSSVIDSNADEPDPQDNLATEFSAFRQPIKDIAIIGSRNIPLNQQNLLEAMAFMLVKDGNTVVTSGGAQGTNAATIRGAMRANPQKLKVILPQTIGQQPPEVQDQLIGVPTIIEHPEWEKLALGDASRLCNREVIDACQQLVIILYHDSTTLLQAIEYAEETQKIITTFYLD